MYQRLLGDKLRIPGSKKTTDPEYDPYDDEWGSSFFSDKNSNGNDKSQDMIFSHVIGDRTARDLKIESANPQHILDPPSRDLSTEIENFAGDNLSLLINSDFQLTDRVSEYESAIRSFVQEDSKYKVPQESFYPDYQKTQGQQESQDARAVDELRTVFTQPFNSQLSS